MTRLLLTFLIAGLALSGVMLDKYPAPISDEAYYSEPAYKLLTKWSIALSLFPPMGGFAESSLMPHGRIDMGVRALIFKAFGVSLWSSRLWAFVSGIGVLALTYAFARRLYDERIAFFSTGLLAISHVFIFASHFARPDITVCLFVMGSLVLASYGWMFLAGLVAALAMDIHPSGNYALWVLAGWVAVNKKFSWLLAFGCLCGLAWWFGVRLAFNSWEFFQAQMFWNSMYGQVRGPLDMLRAEWNRWYWFFWGGAYHRNMFLLFVFSLAVFHAWQQRDRLPYRTLLGLLAGSLAGFTFGVPGKGTVYLVYGYPIMCIATVAMLAERVRGGENEATVY